VYKNHQNKSKKLYPYLIKSMIGTRGTQVK
jgi:hypothetical protein